jgi:hypothetical protein
MFRTLLCAFGKHSIARNRVWHDGFDYRTSCLTCKRALIRDIRHWRVFDAVRDANVTRDLHPKSHDARR